MTVFNPANRQVVPIPANLSQPTPVRPSPTGLGASIPTGNPLSGAATGATLGFIDTLAASFMPPGAFQSAVNGIPPAGQRPITPTAPGASLLSPTVASGGVAGGMNPAAIVQQLMTLLAGLQSAAGGR